MAFLNRLSTLFKANINHAISKAEDPEKMLEQIVADMQEQLTSAKQQVARAITDEKLLKKQRDDQKAAEEKWERKAALAVQNGRDDLAREALARRKEQAQIAAEYQIQWEKQRDAVVKLKEYLVSLEQKIEDAQRKKALLIARQKRSEAQKQIQETLSGMRDTSAFEAFDRMSQKVDEIEAHADAAAEITTDADATREEDFDKLEETDVDNELAALKAKLSEKADDKASE